MTADDHLHDLVGRVGQLEGTIQTFMEQWRMQDQTASSGRRVIHDRLELISTQVARVATDVENVQQDVAEMRNQIDDKVMPTIDGIRLERERKLGAKGVWVLIGGGALAGISGLAWIADKLWSHFRP